MPKVTQLNGVRSWDLREVPLTQSVLSPRQQNYLPAPLAMTRGGPFLPHHPGTSYTQQTPSNFREGMNEPLCSKFQERIQPRPAHEQKEILSHTRAQERKKEKKKDKSEALHTE